MSNEEQIWLSAVRYALPRSTYITSVTSEFIRTKKLSEHCKVIMIRDIQEALNDKHFEPIADCDRKEWEKLLEYLLSK